MEMEMEREQTMDTEDVEELGGTWGSRLAGTWR